MGGASGASLLLTINLTSTNIKTAVQKTAEYIRLRGTKKFQYHLPLEIVNDKTPDTWKKKLI